jgi:bifunctional NMN adenylyltransferase/nudix hydrolase
VTGPRDVTADAAVLIGRYQPFHNGHLGLLCRALELGEWCVVVLGSAQESLTERNPFTWEERAEMIRGSVGAADRARLVFVPMPDLFDEPRWAAQVQRLVMAELEVRNVGSQPSIVFVGHFKDATTEYLRAFPDWPLKNVELLPELHATDLRSWYLSQPVEEALARIEPLVPVSTLAFLRRWAEGPAYRALAG